MRRIFLALTALCLLCSLRAVAATLTYYTSGCNEYIIESESSDPNRAPEWRLIYKCCGQTCFTATSWTSTSGPINACGITIHPPTNGGSGQIRYDADGNALVDVPAGRGGIISYAPDLTCYPFTSNNSNVIVVPREML